LCLQMQILFPTFSAKPWTSWPFGLTSQPAETKATYGSFDGPPSSTNLAAISRGLFCDTFSFDCWHANCVRFNLPHCLSITCAIVIIHVLSFLSNHLQFTYWHSRRFTYMPPHKNPLVTAKSHLFNRSLVFFALTKRNESLLKFTFDTCKSLVTLRSHLNNVVFISKVRAINVCCMLQVDPSVTRGSRKIIRRINSWSCVFSFLLKIRLHICRWLTLW
jgi:hypothetical protein